MPDTDTSSNETPLNQITSNEITSMQTRQLQSSQQEAMKKIAEFSGEHNELDIDEWLLDLTNLFSLMQLKDETKILETMGKLAGPALRWYQENLTKFTKWEDAEKALRDRFTEYLSHSQVMQELFQTQQQEHQSVTSFYEKVIRKHRKARKLITEQQVITVLQAGVKISLKEYLIRNEEEIQTPDDWLKMAKEEESIQTRLQSQRNIHLQEEAQPPYFEQPLPAATIQSKSTNRPSWQHEQEKYKSGQHQQNRQHQQFNTGYNRTQLETNNQNQQNRQHRQFNTGYNRTQLKTNNQNQQQDVDKKSRNNNACMICNCNNHQTNQCYYKKESGCFKCGQSDHRIYNCPKRRFFD
jgi:hypothetical protein